MSLIFATQRVQTSGDWGRGLLRTFWPSGSLWFSHCLGTRHGFGFEFLISMSFPHIVGPRLCF